MKVLIVSVTAGHGHNATAFAISDAMKARGADVTILDVFKYISSILYNAVDKGYSLSTKLTPYQFGRLYRTMETNSILKRSVAAFLTNEIVSEKIFEFTKKARPSIIISTHPFAAQIIDELLYQKTLSAKHIGIITDYTIHPFWEDICNIDGIVICEKTIAYRAIQRGIKPEKLLPFGIPVHQRFLNSIDKQTARETLGIRPDMKTVLFMSGSLGFGNMTKAVKKVASLDIPLQIVCICGHNKRLKSKLQREHFSQPVSVMSFVNNINAYMDASDIVITKPGGLTVSEALAKRKPLILTTPIPGVEEENADYLVNYGLALRATRNISVRELVYTLLTFPERMELLKAAMDNFASDNSAEKLCDYLYGKLTL